MKRGKKYIEAASKIDKKAEYNIAEAIKLAKEASYTKFDASVEFAIKLNVDTRKVDQQLRGAIVLPNGTGNTKKVLVIAKGEAAKAALEAGADTVGDDDIISKIANDGFMDFDTVVATPDMMPSLGRVARILGPKGLMPNPKTGTVTLDVAKAVSDVKKGKVEYRTDTFGNIHVIIGKVSFNDEKLLENAKFFYNTIVKAKPITVKGEFVQSAFVTTTMGPSAKVELNSLTK